MSTRYSNSSYDFPCSFTCIRCSVSILTKIPMNFQESINGDKNLLSDSGTCPTIVSFPFGFFYLP